MLRLVRQGTVTFCGAWMVATVLAPAADIPLMKYGADVGFATRVSSGPLVGITVIAFIVLSYLVHRFVERPIALTMRRSLNTTAFGLRPPTPRP